MNTSLVRIVSKLRARLIEYRSTFPLEINKHINSIEIALCLVEFSMDTIPSRPITLEEEKWFNAGYFVDMILSNSEWEDLSILYSDLVTEVKQSHFLRN